MDYTASTAFMERLKEAAMARIEDAIGDAAAGLEVDFDDVVSSEITFALDEVSNELETAWANAKNVDEFHDLMEAAIEAARP